jgi:hypothetical protein
MDASELYAAVLAFDNMQKKTSKGTTEWINMKLFYLCHWKRHQFLMAFC